MSILERSISYYKRITLICCSRIGVEAAQKPPRPDPGPSPRFQRKEYSKPSPEPSPVFKRKNNSTSSLISRSSSVWVHLIYYIYCGIPAPFHNFKFFVDCMIFTGLCNKYELNFINCWRCKCMGEGYKQNLWKLSHHKC